MGRTRSMMDAVPTDYQAEGFSVVMYAASLGGVLGALCGGAAFEWVTELRLDVLGWDARQVYLAGVQLGYVLVWWLSTRLQGYREQTPAYAVLRSALRRG